MTCLIIRFVLFSYIPFSGVAPVHFSKKSRLGTDSSFTYFYMT
nr:MAG TPA: hypothetical protein [Caudoviricetes sp.]